MIIGPLEYVVIGLDNQHFASEIIPVLNAIREKGAIRVVDLLFLSKVADGAVTMREMSELGEEELQPFHGIAEDLMGLFDGAGRRKTSRGDSPQHVCGRGAPGTHLDDRADGSRPQGGRSTLHRGADRTRHFRASQRRAGKGGKICLEEDSAAEDMG